jgi:hypothetical protein
MVSWDTIMRGWALVEQGRGEEGIAHMRQGLAAWQVTGAEVFLPYFLALFADGCGRMGWAVDGLAVLTEALDRTHRTGERFYEAELYRLYGELSLRIGEPETAAKESANRGRGESETSKRENVSSSPVPRFSGSPVLFSSARFSVSSPEECFQKAIDIAREQQVKSLELRAATSLARLWQSQDKVTEACTLLEGIYGWFTEGFDTADLQEAEALLRALGSMVERKQHGGLARDDAAEQKLALSEAEGFRPSVYIVQASGETAVPSLEPTSTQPPSPNPHPPSPSIFQREGEYWALAFGGVVCRLKENRGMRYLALLLQHPDEELHALQIVADDVLPDAAQPGTVLRGSVPEVVAAEENPQGKRTSNICNFSRLR